LNESEKYKVKAVVVKYIKQVNKDESGDRIRDIENTIKKALNEFEKDSIDNVSLTDQESRFMLYKKGTIELAYNTQITVDHKLGVIVANDVCQDRNDMYQLKPQIEMVEENCGLLKVGTKLCANTGYYPKFDRSVYCIMSKRASCLCFLHTIQSFIPHLMIFYIFQFTKM